MKKLIWKIQYDSTPLVYRHCKKCGKKTHFKSSDQFRVNAQRQYLDIWLIYKCTKCNTTWNATIYSRISPQALTAEQLNQFQENDQVLARNYAFSSELLHKSGTECELPEFSVVGDDIITGEYAEVKLISEYILPIKISAVLRKKLHLSQKAYKELVENGRIKDRSDRNLLKSKLNLEAVFVFLP